MPRVTICVPTYNRADDLRIALRTILRQTYEDWEALVGDDASTDETPAVVAECRDARVRRVERSRNLGIYGNWNDLVRRASGEFVCIYHDHDLYLPTILARSVEALQETPRLSFVHTSLAMIDAANRIVDVDQRDFASVTDGQSFRRRLAAMWPSPVMAATVMARRSAYDRVGAYTPERYGLGCDKDMWFQMAGVGDVGYVQSPQALIRARERHGVTSSFSWQAELQAIRMRKDHVAAVRAETREDLTRQFRDDCDKRLAVLIARSLLLDDTSTAGEGLRAVGEYGGWRARCVATALRRSDLLQTVVRRLGLPWHYRRAEAAARDKARNATAFSWDVESWQAVLWLLEQQGGPARRLPQVQT
jgi:GT2 family glycosyltransferase